MTVLCLNGWAGYSETPCKIIGQTPKRTRIVMQETAYRFKKGHTYLVPKYAVKERT